MSDICDRLVRFAGKVCLSTDTEIEAASEIDRLRAENEKLRDMLLRSDKLTRQEWYDMRNTQLAEEANAAALKETE